MNMTFHVCLLIGLILAGMALIEYFRWRRNALSGIGDSYPVSRLFRRVASVLLLEGVLGLIYYNDVLSRTSGDPLRQFQVLCAAIILALIALMIAVREIRGERRKALGEAKGTTDEIARRMMEELQRQGIIPSGGGKRPPGRGEEGAEK